MASNLSVTNPHQVCKYALKRVDGQPPLPGPEDKTPEKDDAEIESEDEDGKKSTNEESKDSI